MKKDWVICKLDDVIEKMANGSDAKQFNEKIGLPISRIETIWNETIDFERVKYIHEDDEDFIEKYSLKNNDILLSHINSDNHLGKTAIYKTKFGILIHGINLLLLRPSKEINADFLNYQFKHLRFKGDFVAVAQRAVNQSSINQKKLKQFDIKLAPFLEQKAIVGKIEELFSELDNGIENLKTALAKLKIYRQAVLKKAFEGTLTNINTIQWVELKDVIQNVEYGTSSKSLNDGLVPVLRMGNLQHGKIDWDDLKYTSDKDEIAKYKLQMNDVLFNRTNSPEHVGKTSIYKSDKEAIFAGYLIRINYSLDILNGDYLTYYLNSHTAKKYGDSVKSFGVNQSNINGSKLKTYPFPFCSLEEQNLIVQEIETRLSVCDKIEETIANSLAKAESLRQSILKKAYEGNLLTSQELQAIRNHPDYESAEELLKRIKQERK